MANTKKIYVWLLEKLYMHTKSQNNYQSLNKYVLLFFPQIVLFSVMALCLKHNCFLSLQDLLFRRGTTLHRIKVLVAKFLQWMKYQRRMQDRMDLKISWVLCSAPGRTDVKARARCSDVYLGTFWKSSGIVIPYSLQALLGSLTPFSLQ